MTPSNDSGPAVRYPVALGLASFSWALAGWLLAALAPECALVPGVGLLHLLFPSITVVLILTNLRFSLRALFIHRVGIGRLFLVTGMQIGLFTTLFFQLAAHLGAELYHFGRPAASWEWVQFSLAHALRASDVLDVLEAYGLKVQTIKHQSWGVASVVVAYHVVVDLFVLQAVWGLLRGFKEWLMEDLFREYLVRRILGAAFVAWLVAWVLCVFWLRPWRTADVPIWLGENVVRVLDFADALDSFDLHWHQVPREWAESTLTFFYRVWIALGVSLILAWRADRAGNQATAREDSISPWHLPRLGVAAVLLASFLVVGAWARGGQPQRVRQLAEVALGEDGRRAERALAALRRLGPDAGQVVEVLVAGRESRPERQAKIIDTIGWLGPAGVESLQQLALDANEDTAKAAALALCHVGPQAASALAEVWGKAARPSVKAIAESRLHEMGTEAVPWLMQQTNRENSAFHFHWFNELDRNWLLRSTDNETVVALRELTAFRDRVLNERRLAAERPSRSRRRNANREIALSDSRHFSKNWPRYGSAGASVLVLLLDDSNVAVCSQAVGALAHIGPNARVAVPALVKALAHRERDVRRGAVHALARIGPDAVPVLAKVLAHPDSEVHGLAAYKFEQMGTDAVPALIRALDDADLEVRRGAANALGRIGPKAADAVPALARALGDSDSEVRRCAANALQKVELKPRPVVD